VAALLTGPTSRVTSIGRGAIAIVVGAMAIAGCGGSGTDDSGAPATQLSAPATGDVSPPIERVIALGDSQTAGAWLEQPAIESWPAQLNELLCPGSACVDNLGVGGQALVTATPGGVTPLLDTLDDQLASVEQATTAVVLIGQVDLVSSDDVAAITAGYLTLVDRLTEAGLETVLFVTLFPFDPDAYPNPEWLPTLEPRRSALIEGLRELTSASDDVQLVDVEALLTVPGTSWLKPEFGIHDGNHPSPAAAAEIARAVADTLDG
jgi:lysophospholipase L1-like esterase